MVRSLKGSWLPLALVASALIALAAWAALAGPAQADANHVSVGSATVAPGASGSVDVTIDAPAAGLGAWDIKIAYDSDEIQIDSCVKASVGVNLCNADFEGGGDDLAIVGAEPDGVTGSVKLATINFTALGADGECTDLTVTVTTFADATAQANETNPSTTDGQVCVQTPATDTPAPTAAPTDTPAPTATPAALPDTGGAPTSGSSDTVAYLLGVLGLAAVASGAFVFSRMRRTEI